MNLIIGASLFIAGGVFAVVLMSCFAMAKAADERKKVIFASFSENCSSGDCL